MATKKKPAAKTAKKKATAKEVFAKSVETSTPPEKKLGELVDKGDRHSRPTPSIRPHADSPSVVEGLPCCRVCGGEMKSNVCPADGFHLVDAP